MKGQAKSNASSLAGASLSRLDRIDSLLAAAPLAAHEARESQQGRHEAGVEVAVAPDPPPEAREHSEVGWFTSEELGGLPMAPADAAFVSRLRAGGLL